MATRSIGSGAISFGLVQIPFRLYSAAVTKDVHFITLHKACGGRVAQTLTCPTEGGKAIERSDTMRGFEVAKDQIVAFTSEELAELEAEGSGALTIEEVVPAESVDSLYVRKTYFLGPDKGGAHSYRLLSHVLERSGVVGVGRFRQRGKDELVFVRPYNGGLILHESFYAEEVRSFEEVDIGAAIVEFSAEEIDLATMLVTQLRRDAFDASRYTNSWAEKVLAAAQRKIAGERVAAPAAEPRAVVVDLVEALKRSVGANAEAVREADSYRKKLQSEAAQHGPGTRKAAPRQSTDDAPPETVAQISGVQLGKAKKTHASGKKKSG